MSEQLIETDRFSVIGPDGRSHTVIERTRLLSHRPLAESPQHAKGSKDYILSDGRDVNYLDEETYQIVMTDEILKKR